MVFYLKLLVVFCDVVVCCRFNTKTSVEKLNVISKVFNKKVQVGVKFLVFRCF